MKSFKFALLSLLLIACGRSFTNDNTIAMKPPPRPRPTPPPCAKYDNCPGRQQYGGPNASFDVTGFTPPGFGEIEISKSADYAKEIAKLPNCSSAKFDSRLKRGDRLMFSWQQFSHGGNAVSYDVVDQVSEVNSREVLFERTYSNMRYDGFSGVVLAENTVGCRMSKKDEKETCSEMIYTPEFTQHLRGRAYHACRLVWDMKKPVTEIFSKGLVRKGQNAYVRKSQYRVKRVCSGQEPQDGFGSQVTVVAAGLRSFPGACDGTVFNLRIANGRDFYQEESRRVIEVEAP